MFANIEGLDLTSYWSGAAQLSAVLVLAAVLEVRLMSRRWKNVPSLVRWIEGLAFAVVLVSAAWLIPAQMRAAYGGGESAGLSAATNAWISWTLAVLAIWPAMAVLRAASAELRVWLIFLRMGVWRGRIAYEWLLIKKRVRLVVQRWVSQRRMRQVSQQRTLLRRLRLSNRWGDDDRLRASVEEHEATLATYESKLADSLDAMNSMVRELVSLRSTYRRDLAEVRREFAPELAMEALEYGLWFSDAVPNSSTDETRHRSRAARSKNPRRSVRVAGSRRSRH